MAPEVCLTGFDYENFEEAQEFSKYAIEKIKAFSHDRIIVLTLIKKLENEVCNVVHVFHNGEIVHERAKAKLFTFGGEERWFSPGDEKSIDIIELDGMKLAILICFELRFKELWQKVQGADIVAVPAWWGVIRSDHYKTLTKALAIMNQCYVVASDAANDECSKMSGIITPMGVEERNGNTPCLEVAYDAKEIKKMRRYMDVGIG